MRAEKVYINQEYVERLNSASYFIMIDYRGLTVDQFSELRNRLRTAGAECHVVKNTIFKIAVKELELADLSGQLAGQLAAVTGDRDISAAAKVLKNFHAEFEKPRMVFGYLDKERLESENLTLLADLPPLDVLRGKIVGLIQTPASQLARIINTPGTQLAQVLKARVDKES